MGDAARGSATFLGLSQVWRRRRPRSGAHSDASCRCRGAATPVRRRWAAQNCKGAYMPWYDGHNPPWNRWRCSSPEPPLEQVAMFVTEWQKVHVSRWLSKSQIVAVVSRQTVYLNIGGEDVSPGACCRALSNLRAAVRLRHVDLQHVTSL